MIVNERAPVNTEGATFLDLHRTSAAITIFAARRKNGAPTPDPTGIYSDTRDRNALEQGLRILVAPADPRKRYRYEVDLGNVVDWKKRPANMPHAEYMTSFAEETKAVVSDVLSGNEVSDVRLSDAASLFQRWSTYARSQPLFPTHKEDREWDFRVGRLNACRNEIDKVDENIIFFAGNKGFEAAVSDISSLVDDPTSEYTTEISVDVVLAMAERRRVSHEIGEIKFALGTGPTDHRREQEMKDNRHEWGRNANLTEKQVDELMTLLMTDSKRIQAEVQSELKAGATK